jgi:hypothetical protein
MGLQQLDDFHEKQNENNEQDKADSTAAVVSESRSHAIAAKAEHQNQNEQKDKHLSFSPFGEVSPHGGVMQILLLVQKNLLGDVDLLFTPSCFVLAGATLPHIDYE